MPRLAAVPAAASSMPATRRTVLRPTARSIRPASPHDMFEHVPIRKTTVELKRTPWYQHWYKPYKAMPEIPAEREVERQLVLDIDDLSAALTAAGTTGPVGAWGGEALLGSLLGVGTGLCTWFGVIASIRQIYGSTHGLHHLHLQAERIRREYATVRVDSTWSIQRRQALAELLAFTGHDRRLEITLLTFSGAVALVASTFEIAGFLTDSALLGAAIPALAVAAIPLLTAGMPLTALFAGGNAVLNFQRYARAKTEEQYVAAVAATCPWDPAKVPAQALLEKRLHEVRAITMVNGIGFAGIGIGAPLSFFGGLYGIAVLAPAIVLAGVGSYTENAKLAYQNPLRVDELIGLVTMEQITNVMGFVYCDYLLLKQLKHEKRRAYPYGMSAPFLVRGLMAPYQAVIRGLSPDHDSHATPEQTLRDYALARGQLLATYLAQDITMLRKYLHQGEDAHLRHELQHMEQRLADTRSYNAELTTTPTALGLTFAERSRRLFHLLADCRVVGPFAESLAKEPEFRTLLGLQGAQCEVDLEKLKGMIAVAPNAEHLLTRLCERAEHMFFTVVKDWRHSRVRELADLALFRAQHQKSVTPPMQAPQGPTRPVVGPTRPVVRPTRIPRAA